MLMLHAVFESTFRLKVPLCSPACITMAKPVRFCHDCWCVSSILVEACPDCGDMRAWMIRCPPRARFEAVPATQVNVEELENEGPPAVRRRINDAEGDDR